MPKFKCDILSNFQTMCGLNFTDILMSFVKIYILDKNWPFNIVCWLVSKPKPRQKIKCGRNWPFVNSFVEFAVCGS